MEAWTVAYGWHATCMTYVAWQNATTCSKRVPKNMLKRPSGGVYKKPAKAMNPATTKKNLYSKVYHAEKKKFMTEKRATPTNVALAGEHARKKARSAVEDMQ